MSFLQQLRKRFYFKSLQQQLKARKPANERGAVNLDKARRIGLLFDADEVDMRNAVQHYAEALRKRGKHLHLLGYLSEHQEGAEFPFHTFSQKDIDWRLRPGGSEVEAFLSESFDLLLHLSLSPNLQSEYISALSKAQLRVGPSTDHTYAYDLMIDIPEAAGLKAMIAQIEAVLGKTNTTDEPAIAT